MTEKEMAKEVKEVRDAIRDGDVTKLASFLGADETRRNLVTFFGSWLHVAASFGQVGAAEWLLMNGADVNAKTGTTGGTPLHEAAAAGSVNMVTYLIDAGADLNISEPAKNPLFAAILKDRIDVLKVLLAAGMDPHLTYSGDNLIDVDAVAFAQLYGSMEARDLLAGS